jgi:hypothetical protein
VDWFLRLPTKKSIRSLQPAQVTAVARRLAELADSQPELSDLATDVWGIFMLMLIAADFGCCSKSALQWELRPASAKHAADGGASNQRSPGNGHAAQVEDQSSRPATPALAKARKTKMLI